MSNVDINVDRRTDWRTDWRTENRTPISHPATSRCDKKDRYLVKLRLGISHNFARNIVSGYNITIPSNFAQLCITHTLRDLRMLSAEYYVYSVWFPVFLGSPQNADIRGTEFFYLSCTVCNFRLKCTVQVSRRLYRYIMRDREKD